MEEEKSNGSKKVDGRVNNGAKPGENLGQGRKPNIEKLRESLKKEIYDVTRLEFWAKLADTEAVAVLKANMATRLGDPALKAALEVLNRALGKSKERHEVTGLNGQPLVDPSALAASIANLLGKK